MKSNYPKSCLLLLKFTFIPIIRISLPIIFETILILATSRSSRQNTHQWRHWATIAITGTISSILELVFIIAFISQDLLISVAILILPSVILGSLLVYSFLKNEEINAEKSLAIHSPLDIWRVLRLSTILASILVFVTLAQNYAGDLGSNAASFLSGLFELHGVSFAAATLYSQEKMLLPQALKNIEIAVMASVLLKIAISCFVGRGKFRWVFSIVLLCMGALMLIANLVFSKIF